MRRALELCSGDAEQAEDLVQDTYVRLLERRPTYRSDRQLEHWMRKVMRNLNNDRLRARARLDRLD